MPYSPFHVRFPDIGVTEYRMVMPIVDGKVVEELLFVERYCNEPDCDCRRVVVKVFSEKERRDGGSFEVADLSFGWEPESYYRRWAGGPVSAAQLKDLKGPAVRMLTPQTSRSNEMLGHFQTLLGDPAYVARIRRHYAMFRAAIDQESARATRPPVNRRERRAARRRSGVS